jgi:uncharacterized protein (TIGR00299 family) protein
MRIAILDPFAGVSGDMILGSLVDATGDDAWLRDLTVRVGFPDVEVRVERVSRCSVAAAKVDFLVPDTRAAESHGRHVGELTALVRSAELEPTVKETAIAALELVGEAEGKVHGVAPDRVHLHEVGAIDAVLDIVGAVEGFKRLGATAVYNLPVAIGDGWVETEHGKLPVPAPATSILLEGVTVSRAGPVTGESVTPTGAALVRVLSAGEPPDCWRALGVGWGAGTRNPEEYPNSLRLIVAEAARESGLLEVVATDIDDLSPEYLEPLREAVMAAGAVECVAWATLAKKGRVGLRVEALAPAGQIEQVVDALFAHSTTAGVRRWATARSTLARQELVVELGEAKRVRIKVLDSPRGPRTKAEYEDVTKVAEELGVPALDVARQAERLAETILAGQGYNIRGGIGEDSKQIERREG